MVGLMAYLWQCEKADWHMEDGSVSDHSCWPQVFSVRHKIPGNMLVSLCVVITNYSFVYKTVVTSLLHLDTLEVTQKVSQTNFRNETKQKKLFF